jgi:glycosyltransferase involved in cell wall biosynthesis
MDLLRNIFNIEELSKASGKVYLVRCIDRPWTEEEKRKQMDMIRQRYDWKKIAEKTLEVYRRVVSS